MQTLAQQPRVCVRATGSNEAEREYPVFGTRLVTHFLPPARSLAAIRGVVWSRDSRTAPRDRATAWILERFPQLCSSVRAFGTAVHRHPPTISSFPDVSGTVVHPCELLDMLWVVYLPTASRLLGPGHLVLRARNITGTNTCIEEAVPAPAGAVLDHARGECPGCAFFLLEPVWQFRCGILFTVTPSTASLQARALDLEWRRRAHGPLSWLKQRFAPQRFAEGIADGVAARAAAWEGVLADPILVMESPHDGEEPFPPNTPLRLIAHWD